MFQFQEQNRTIDKMETSAFADIIFLLLIFFLLSSSFILRTEIPVTVPKSSSTVSEKEDPIVITLSRNGDIHVDEEKVSEIDLPTALGTYSISAAPAC